MKGNPRNMVPLFLIILVIFISGCSTQGINYTEKEEKEIADVITIEKIEAFPVSPVYAGRDFKLYVTLKNNDKKRVVDYVLAEIYDASVFTVNGESSKAVGSMLPLGQSVVTFDLTAPDAERLANVETEGLISVRVKYLFESETTFDIVALNEDEITKHQQAGDSISVLSSKLIGSGPIRIYPEMVGSDRSILIGTTKGSVAFTLKNEGTGFLEGGQIPKGWFSVEFPQELSVSSDYSGSSATGNILFSSPATGMVTSCPAHDDGTKQGGCLYQCCVRQGYSMYIANECIDTNAGGSTQIRNGMCTFYDNQRYSSCFHGVEYIGVITDSLGNTCDCYCGIAEPCLCQSGNCDQCTESGCVEGPQTCDDEPYSVTTTTIRSTSRTTTVRTTTTTIYHIPVNPPDDESKVVFSQSGNTFTSTEKDIEVLGKESLPFIFYTSSPEVDAQVTYTIHASVKYVYEIRKDEQITIRPVATP